MQNSSLKKNLVFSLFGIVLGTITLFILGEGLLFVGDLILDRDYLKPQGETKSLDDYPGNSDEYVKIAIFGGSAAYGYLAERHLGEVINYELSNAYPEKKFFVKNYALPGNPFHRVQARYLREQLRRYDIVLIYAGNNEAQNYIDQSGIFRTDEAKENRIFGTDEQIAQYWKNYFGLTKRSFIEKNSRIYRFSLHVLKRLKERTSKVDEYQQESIKLWNFTPLAGERMLPEEEYQAIYANFRTELETIAKEAETLNKTVLISDVIGDDFWKPGISLYSEQTNQDQKEDIKNLIKEGQSAFNAKDFATCIEKFARAHQIDPRPAIVNYYLGRSYYELGNIAKGRGYLLEAVNLDGWHTRSTENLHKISREVADQSKVMTFVDIRMNLYRLLDNGLENQPIFSDLMHPSMLGHIIMGLSFACELSKLNLVNGGNTQAYQCRDFSSPETLNLDREYKEKLAVTFDEIHNESFYKARFNIGTSWYATEYPEDFLELGLKQLDTYRDEISNVENPLAQKGDEITYKVFKALIHAKRDENDLALKELNESLEIRDGVTFNLLKKSLNNGLVIGKVFQRHNIFINSQQNGFELRTGGKK